MAQKKDMSWYLAQTRRIAEHREEGAEQEIRKLYRKLNKELQSFVSDAYIKYGRDDQLTFAMLQEAGEKARFLLEVERNINVTTPRTSKVLHKLVEDTYKIAYDGVVDAALHSTDAIDEVFADSIAITPHQVKAAVENPVDKLTLSKLLEKNRREIIYEIKKTITVGLLNGDRYTTMAQRISKVVDGDYKKAIRIARTEAHRVREAGDIAASLEVDAELQKGASGLRMVKVWRTMKDERVRPQRLRKGKKGWVKSMGKGANHMKLHGQTVLVDEPFDLLDGNKAMMPGSANVAGHDINCRCYASKKLMIDEEYYKATGKHFPGWKNTGNSAIIEPEISDEARLITDALDAAGVEYRAVNAHDTPLSITEIVDVLGGGDKTQGSCASLGLAYMGQRSGLDVLDFRGGESQKFFARTLNLRNIATLPGVDAYYETARSSNTAGNRLLKQVEKGKEYYFVCGRHGAIVRKNADDVLEYMELQSMYDNGWHAFDGNPRYTLSWRFGEVKGMDYTAFMIDVDSFKDSPDLRRLLGYINTAQGEQKKGVGGHVK